MMTQNPRVPVRPPWLIWSIAAAVAATAMMSALPIVFRNLHETPLPPRWSMLGWWTAGVVGSCCILGVLIWRLGKTLARRNAEGRAMIATLMATMLGLITPILLVVYSLLLLVSVVV